MSSEIFYDKAFIRVEEKYIPVVNHGSSNCFEFDSRGREIPEKNWSVLNYPYPEQMLFTAEEIQKIADFYEEVSMSNRGGTKKSRNRAFEENEFRRWILSGMKSAYTVEEYAEFGNRVIVIDYSEDRWMKYVLLGKQGYFVKRSSRRIWFAQNVRSTHSAIRKFKTEKAAQKYLTDNQKFFSGCAFTIECDRMEVRPNERVKRGPISPGGGSACQ